MSANLEFSHLRHGLLRVELRFLDPEIAISSAFVIPQAYVKRAHQNAPADT
jgi:hypothetical protein